MAIFFFLLEGKVPKLIRGEDGKNNWGMGW